MTNFTESGIVTPPQVPPMKRRNLLRNTLLGATGTSLLAARNSSAQSTERSHSTAPQHAIEWRMATSWPQSLDLIFGGVQLLCQRVKEMTNGQFIITPYEAGKITPALEILDAVQTGKTECGHTASHYYLDKNPALAFATTLPFGLTAYQQFSWLYYGGGLETMQKLYADFNVISFPAGNSGVQMGGWFKTEIQSVENFKGLKFRMAGFGGQVMARLGAQIKALGSNQIYDALKKGEIDGAEWQNPYGDEKLGLHKVAPYYYYPGWWEPGTTYEVLVNRTQWDKLPKAYQHIFKSAAAEVSITMLANLDAANGEALQRLVKGGTQLRAYSRDILQAAYKTTFELLDEKASQDASFREVYDRWKMFRTRIYQWNRVNELSLDRFTLQNSV